MRFQDQVVIVTGGSLGIGRAYVRAFNAEGAKVVVLDVEGLTLKVFRAPDTKE